ncbi:MAG: SspB family protein [Paracoccaceae bacterium]
MIASGRLDYGNLMQLAMRGMMAEVLSQVAENGLPGEHHFYISFDTGHPGVDMPDWLKDSYPDEMTIVLQEWFANLAVTPDRFSVTLNFSDQAQTLVIPLAAVKTFVDPSVKFGLKFDPQEPDEEEIPSIVLDTGEEESAAPEGGSADVVSLDSFRKP